jgi:hypothetical protein
MALRLCVAAPWRARKPCRTLAMIDRSAKADAAVANPEKLLRDFV